MQLAIACSKFVVIASLGLCAATGGATAGHAAMQRESSFRQGLYR
jgi:hypothetical protein